MKYQAPRCIFYYAVSLKEEQKISTTSGHLPDYLKTHYPLSRVSVKVSVFQARFCVAVLFKDEASPESELLI